MKGFISMQIDLDRIPLFLRRIPKWAGFIIEGDGKKPISIKDMLPVGANALHRLVDFDTAAQAVREGKFEHIGVSMENEELTTIDLDCKSEDKRELYEQAKQDILAMFPGTYCETSASGLGVHIYVKGKKPEGYKNKDKHGVVEVYDDTHFMVVTGWALEGHTTYVGICQDELNTVCEKYLLKKETFSNRVGQNMYSKTDDEVIDKIYNFKKGRLFMEGRWAEVKKWDDKSGTYISAFPSQSEADFSFAGLILYLNGNNVDQAVRLFKKSKMWDEKRKKKKSKEYVETTISNASIKCNRVYEWEKEDYTDTEQTIDFDEVMATYIENELVAVDNVLVLSDNLELNLHLTKYISIFGTIKRAVHDTTNVDYDSAGNGHRFWLLNHNDLIYLPEGDEWLAWNGKCWDRCYDKNLLVYAERVFHYLKHEAYNLFLQSISDVDFRLELEKKAIALFEYASTNKGKKECLEMIEFSKSRFIQAQKEQKILDKVNANLNVLNLQNGVYDLDSMTFVPHDRKYLQTKMAGAEYEENAECPLWTGLLETVLPNAEVRKYFQKAVGYTISSGYMEKCMFVLYGENGNNGKTTINKTIYKLLGDYAVAAEKQTIMDTRGHSAGSPRPDLARLRDRRFVCISENEKDDKLAEGLIKNLTGGGVIICRTLHHEPIEFPAIFKIFLDTNYRPQVKGTDQALWRRLKVLKFDVTLPPEKIDLNFGEKLEKELSGILNWAIEGYRLYKAEGLDMPEEMQNAIKDYAEDMSPLDQWLTECVDYSKEGYKGRITSKVLYQSYYNWCKFNHEYALGQRRFTQEINLKEWFKDTKKVKGYTQYLKVTLNGVGCLFATGDMSDEQEFRKKYNDAVQSAIHSAQTEELFNDAFGKFKAIPPDENKKVV